MKSNWADYEYVDSFKRIKDVLASSEYDYEESSSLPSRDKLTYTNGYYANCSAVFVDIRKSSSLPSKYRRPKLAKLYRAYISEMVAVMNSDRNCREINIVGDGIWSVFDTPLKRDIDSVFSATAKMNSVKIMLNYLLQKNGYDSIEIGIGAAYGRALMVKAGLNGSGVNDVVYMGDVVNHAAKLAAVGNETYFDNTLMISRIFYNNLSDKNKALMTYHATREAYHGNIVNVKMQEWYDENCT